MTLRAVLVDLDGTLVSSIPALRATYDEYLRAMGISGDGGGFARWDGVALKDVVATLAREHALEGTAETLFARYNEILAKVYAAKVELAEGASELVASCRDRGLALALVTSAPRASVSEILRRLGVHDAFRVIVTSDDTARTKPDPEPYARALELLSSTADESFAVEDSPAGVRAAAGAGLRCIALDGGDVKRARELRAAGAVATAIGLHDVKALVDGLADGVGGRSLRASRITVDLTGDMVVPDDVEAKARSIFADASAKNPKMTDGAIASATAWSAHDGSLRLSAVRASYRHFLAARAGVHVGVTAIGVTGLLLVTQTDGSAPKIAVGKRASDVTQYPGRWECVPSGGLSLAAGELPNPELQIRTELSEEVDLAPGIDIAVEPLGIVEDFGESVDVAYLIRCALPSGVKLAPRSEYDALRLVEVEELRRETEANAGGFVPTVGALLVLAGDRLRV